MLLSIITINYNNAEGLRKTLASVVSQTYAEIEHIIIDGGSTDSSVEVIREYADNQAKGERLEAKGTGNEVKGEENGEADTTASTLYTLHSTPTEISTPIYTNLHDSTQSTHIVRWISEKDTGIYNAMNKGIRMATGEYCQFLNSGDVLAADDVTERMVNAINAHHYKVESGKCKGMEDSKADNKVSRLTPLAYHIQDFPTIFYGNMRKLLPNGKILHDACKGENNVTLDMFYRGCLNHSPAYINRSLFDKYGMYDENLRICSDWKFYVQSIILGGEKVQYVDIDMTLFDMMGISETNKDLLHSERNQLLKEMIPPGILRDYDNYHFVVDPYKRLKKYHLWGLVYFVERVLFKLEKWHILR